MEDFIEELRGLMTKYSIKVGEIEHYDNDESYIGSSFYFTDGRGRIVFIDEIPNYEEK